MVCVDVGAVMDEVGSPAVRRSGAEALSSIRTETIESLTDLEDLERVYAQLCAEEVNFRFTFTSLFIRTEECLH